MALAAVARHCVSLHIKQHLSRTATVVGRVASRAARRQTTRRQVAIAGKEAETNTDPGFLSGGTPVVGHSQGIGFADVSGSDDIVPVGVTVFEVYSVGLHCFTP